MRVFKNEKGIALAMVLMLSLTAMVIVLGIIYMVTQSTFISGALRFYNTAEEASFGSLDVGMGYINNRGVMNILGAGFPNGCNCQDPNDPNDNIDSNAGNFRTCRCDKICNATVDWGYGALPMCVAPGAFSVNPTQNPDFTLTLPNNFTVFVKIVDTVGGNTDQSQVIQQSGTSGMAGGAGIVQLGGGAVESSNASQMNTGHRPFLYRLEVQAQSTVNVREVSRMTVLYAY